MSNPAGETTVYSSSSGLLATVEPPYSDDPTLTIDYNGSGQVTSLSKDGGPWTYSYGNGSTTTTTPSSATTTVTYDSENLIKTSTIANQTTTFDYCESNETNCPEGLLKSRQKPEGQTTAYQYDGRGNVTQVTRTDSSGSNAITTSAIYPSTCSNALTCNKPSSTTDEAGNTTDYTYSSSHGFVLRIIMPETNGYRLTNKFYYDSYYGKVKKASGGLVTQSTSVTLLDETRRCRTGSSCANTADEEVSRITFNNSSQPNLLPVKTEIELGNGTLSSSNSYKYNVVGQLVSVDGPEGGSKDKVYYRYDDAWRPVGKISADPDGYASHPRLAQRITYDDGLIIKQETGTVTGTSASAWNNFIPDQRIDFDHDDYGRIITERHRDTGSNRQYSATQYSYDPSGRLTCTAQRMNAPFTSTSLPSSACTAMSAGSNGPDRITKNVYDTDGRLIEVRSGVDTALEQVTRYLSYYTSSSANGQLRYVEDAKGNRTQYVYDDFGRHYRTKYPSPDTPHESSSTDNEYVFYDQYGRIDQFRSRRAEYFDFTYDGLGRVTHVDVPTRSGLSSTHSRDIYYGYDAFGNLEYARFDSASGEGITNTYNALSQLLTSTNNMDSTSRTLSYDYDVAGRLTRLTHPDGVSFTYQYDLLGRLDLLKDPDNTNLLNWNYDNQGRASERIGNYNAPDTNYAYDEAGRLDDLFIDHKTSNSYDVNYGLTFNPAEQIASETRDNDSYAFDSYLNFNIDYDANGLNQYTSVDAASYSYDDNGNLISDGSTAFVYDTENRLVSAIDGSDTVTLRYDPLGRLYEVEDHNGDKRRLYYSGDDLVLEYDGSGAMLNRYVHGLSEGDDPLISYDGNSALRENADFINVDRLGSVVLMTNHSGSIKAVNSYDEYGVPGSANGGRFQYTGQTWVPELGLYYYKARMYSPTLGRFMQTDPIGYADGMNWYAYAGNDPVSSLDPTGLYVGTGCDEAIEDDDEWDNSEICVVADPYPGIDWIPETNWTTTDTWSSSGSAPNEPQKEKYSCDTPYFRNLLERKDVRDAIADSIRMSAADNNYEYGFMYGRKFDSGHGVGGVYTSGYKDAIDPGLAGSNVGEGIYWRSTFFHLHPNGTGLHSEDEFEADLRLINIVAFGPDGEVSCYGD